MGRPSRRKTSGESAANSSASTTPGGTRSTAICTFVQQESEFFDLDKSDYGLAPVQVEVWEGFIFVNLDPANTTSLMDFLGPLGKASSAIRSAR